MRILMDELAVHDGMSAAALYLDIEKFHDSVSWQKLLHEGDRVDFPLRLLIIGAYFHCTEIS